MTIGFLTGMLVKDVWVTIKDSNTKATLWEGEAALANFNDKVKDWDFSKGHIIYI